MRPTKLFRTLLPLLLLAASPTFAAPPASPLADHIPDDAVAYVGWQGTDALGPAYQGSNLKAFVDTVELNKLLDQVLQFATDQAGGDAKKLGILHLVTTLGTSIVKHPTALYFGGIDLKAEKPVPNIALLIQCGKAEATDLAATIQKGIDDNKQPDAPPVAAQQVGDFFLFTIGGNPSLLRDQVLGLAKLPMSPLSDNKQFVAAEAQTGEDAALRLYVNADAGLKLIDQIMLTRGGDRGAEMWPKISDAIGIDALHAVAMGSNFDGKDWSSHVFLGMAEKRTGVLQFFDNPPLSANALKVIPKGAAFAGVLRLDASRVYNDIRDAAARVDDNAQQAIDNGMQRFTDFTKVDVVKDIIYNLSDELVYYSVPDATGSVLKGVTLVTKAKDGAALEKAISDLEELAQAFGGRGGGGLTINVEQGDVSVHVLSWKGGGFAWAVQDNTWIIGLSSATVKAAATFVAKGGPDITENPEFAAMIKKLAVDKMSSFSFTDMSKTGPEVYGLLSEALDRAKADNPDSPIKFTLPAFDKLKPFLTTRGSVFWADKQGWHMKLSEPFPGSDLLGGGEMALQLWAQKAGAEAQQNALNAQSGAKLRSISTGVLSYTTDNNIPPADLAALFKADLLKPEDLVKNRQKLPADWRSKGDEARIAWVLEHSDYVYVPQAKAADLTAETVIAYEKYAGRKTGKVYAAFGDGHVELVEIKELEDKLKK